MNNKILLQLMDTFRAESIYDRGASLSLVMIAWYKASMKPECPTSLQIKNCQGIDPQDFVKKMAELSVAIADPAFVIEDGYISRLRQPTISAAISQCLSLGLSGLLNDFDPTDVAISFEARELVFPVEVCDLMVGLAGRIQGEVVYLPWESNGQLSGRIIKAGATGMVETTTHTKLPELVSSILSDGKHIHVAHNNLLRNPYYLENGRLRVFGTTIALLPFGVSVEAEVVERDLYNRFSEKTRSMTVLTLRHILAQTKGRVIITAMNSLLFSSGPERSLREDLLNKQQIEAVVAVPAGLLDATAIPFTILVINTERRCDTVRFVNADNALFKEDISRTKTRLINVDKLIEVILTSPDSEAVKNVSTQDIIFNDAQLQVNRYALGVTERKVASLLATMECKRLEDIAILGKPSATIASDNGITIFEVGASDIPDYGFIRTATKQIMVDSKVGKSDSQFLLPRDIVLITKGSLGKVGIVPDNVPAPGDGGWIAGQSAVVIRVKKSSGIDPRALFMLLKSDLGKELVKTLASGSAIPFVQLRELKQLPIPIPTDLESISSSNVFMEEEALQNKINELQQLQASLAVDCWSIS